MISSHQIIQINKTYVISFPMIDTTHDTIGDRAIVHSAISYATMFGEPTAKYWVSYDIEAQNIPPGYTALNNQLNSCTKNDNLILISHGSPDQFGQWKEPKDLVALLQGHGLKTVNEIKLGACCTGAGKYAQNFALALTSCQISFQEIVAYTAEVATVINNQGIAIEASTFLDLFWKQETKNKIIIKGRK